MSLDGLRNLRTLLVVSSEPVSSPTSPEAFAAPSRAFSSLPARLAAVLAIAVACVAVAWALREFRIDDDFILLRYAERFLAGDGLTFNDGESVNGITSVASLLAMVAAGLLGLDPFHGAAVLALTGLVLSASALTVAARRAGTFAPAAVLAGCLLVFVAPLAVWSSSAVGSVLLAGLIGWSALLAVENRPGAMWLLAAACWVRLDASVLVLGVLAGWVVLHGRRARLRAAVTGVAASLVMLFVFQRVVFGSWFSNVASVKFRFDTSQLPAGVVYVRGFLLVASPLIVMLIMVFVVALSRRRFSSGRVSSRFGQWSGNKGLPQLRLVLPALIPAVLYLGYLLFVGGDWMPAHRLTAPVLVLFAVAAAQALPGRFPGWVLVPALLVSVGVSFVPGTRERVDTSVMFVDQCRVAAEVLGEIARPGAPLLAVEPAGCLPAWTGFPTVDMVGLVDPTVAATPTPGRTLDWDSWLSRYVSSDRPSSSDLLVGHARANGDHVWSRHPDVLVPCSPASPIGRGCFASWAQIEERHNIVDTFTLIRVRVDDADPSSFWHLWVRFTDGPLGVRVTKEGLSIPAHLLATGDARIEVRAGEIVVVIPSGVRVGLPWLTRLGEGTWRFGGVPAGMQLVSTASCSPVVDGALLRVGPDCVPAAELFARREVVIPVSATLLVTASR